MYVNNVLNTDFLKEYKNIYIEQVSARQFPLPRKYDCYTLAYIAHNTGSINIKSTKIAVFEGDIFLIYPNTEYQFCDNDQNHSLGIYYCYFTPTRFKSFWNDIEQSFPMQIDFFKGYTSYLHTKDNRKNEYRDLFVKMIDDFIHHREGYSHTVQCRLVIFLTDMLRKINKDENTVISVTSNEIIDRFLPKLELSLYSKTDVKKLAAAENITEEYLCYLFKKNTNMTITQYVNILRVEKIKDMLINTTRPIDLILNKFTLNSAYIKRVFKNKTGCTLKEYREKYAP